MNKLKEFQGKVLEINDLEKILKCDEYSSLYKIIKQLCIDNIIKPIKTSGSNGKSPVLYKRYKVIRKEANNEELIDEITYKLSSTFNIEFYLKHLDKYKEHRGAILKLNSFILNKSHLLNEKISMNERAFQIWGREKFLQKEGGKTIIKNLGLTLDKLNYYDTSEPLAYYSKSKEVPQKILILENKDTYYTLRRYLIAGGEKILGEDVKTVIYGGGKNIQKAFNDFKISVEEYVYHEGNTLLYFGDLDYEGIIIYEGLYNLFHKEYNIEPFVKGYEKMIDKTVEENISLPETKEGQNRNITDLFLNKFSEKYKIQIENILKGKLYIPQEILNIGDL